MGINLSALPGRDKRGYQWTAPYSHQPTAQSGQLLSELKPQPHLYNPRAIRLGCDRAKCRLGRIHIRASKLSPVERVESFEPVLQLKSLPESEVLHQRKIGVIRALRSKVIEHLREGSIVVVVRLIV